MKISPLVPLPSLLAKGPEVGLPSPSGEGPGVRLLLLLFLFFLPTTSLFCQESMAKNAAPALYTLADRVLYSDTTRICSSGHDEKVNPAVPGNKEITRGANFTIGIRDELGNKALKEVLDDIQKNESGKVGAIIDLVSHTDARWTWKLREGKLPAAIIAYTQLSGDGALTIIDMQKLRRATRLSVARTLIHELIHVYLSGYYKKDPIHAIEQYPGILREWHAKKHPDYNRIQHNEIEKSFRDDIALSLKEYGERNGLNVPDQIYADLAWGGLDFKHTKNLAEDDKVRIQHRLSAELLSSVFETEAPAGPGL